MNFFINCNNLFSENLKKFNNLKNYFIMNIMNLSVEEKNTIKTLFKEMRAQLAPYFEKRNVQFSNPQLFTFLSYCPSALAIASDRVVDESEKQIIELIGMYMNVDKMVNMEFLEMMSIAPEPENCLTNEDFNAKVAAELLYVCENMEQFEENFVQAVKAMLKFDSNPKADTSMTKSFVTMMNAIIDNNTAENKEDEKTKLIALFKRLDIEV